MATDTKKRPELLAPAGNYEMLRAAISGGADAIYFGVKGLNMRAFSKNFTEDDIKDVVKECHDNDMKTYLAMNTIIYEDELEKVRSSLKKAKEAEIDAIICWDHSVMSIAKELGLEIHISTQASISNSMSAKFYKDLGATRCVLAREVTLEDLKKIKENTDIELEIFIHGAMCVSVSGRCFMSEQLYGKSANRGECLQPCRRSYNIKDPETGKEMEMGENYVMSAKDLCTLPFLEKIAPYAESLKIEGRGKNPEYVKNVVEAYREALDLISEDKYDEDEKKRLMEKVGQVYNRGFSSGFYMGRPIQEFTDSYGSKATRKKEFIGKVENFFKGPSVAEIKLNAGSLEKGDEILFIGSSTGVVEKKIDAMRLEDKEVERADKGQNITLKTDEIVRKNDKVYVWRET